MLSPTLVSSLLAVSLALISATISALGRLSPPTLGRLRTLVRDIAWLLLVPLALLPLAPARWAPAPSPVAAPVGWLLFAVRLIRSALAPAVIVAVVQSGVSRHICQRRDRARNTTGTWRVRCWRPSVRWRR